MKLQFIALLTTIVAVSAVPLVCFPSLLTVLASEEGGGFRRRVPVIADRDTDTPDPLPYYSG